MGEFSRIELENMIRSWFFNPNQAEKSLTYLTKVIHAAIALGSEEAEWVYQMMEKVENMIPYGEDCHITRVIGFNIELVRYYGPFKDDYSNKRYIGTIFEGNIELVSRFAHNQRIESYWDARHVAYVGAHSDVFGFSYVAGKALYAALPFWTQPQRLKPHIERYVTVTRNARRAAICVMWVLKDNMPRDVRRIIAKLVYQTREANEKDWWEVVERRPLGFLNRVIDWIFYYALTPLMPT